MKFTRIARLVAVLICLGGSLAAQPAPLTIGDETLPSIEAGIEFHALLHAHGGAPPYIWSVVSGDLPEGVSLSPEGMLAGRPTKSGSFDVTLRVEDSARPANTINKEFEVTVTASLVLEWLHSPKVQDSRIDGVAMVSNGSKDTFDLTVVIVAVAENGRATAIGYQHFDLKAGSTNVEIPFGSALGFGAYVIHADAIAEIPKRGAILRQRLQTPQPLEIVQNP